jgi:hypothetical protein
MSNPMSSGEIEDVLSSIRKLVARDDAVAAAPGATGTDGQERLVLSPETRVASASSADDGAAQKPFRLARPISIPVTPSLSQAVAELEARVMAKVERWEAEAQAEAEEAVPETQENGAEAPQAQAAEDMGESEPSDAEPAAAEPQPAEPAAAPEAAVVPFAQEPLSLRPAPAKHAKTKPTPMPKTEAALRAYVSEVIREELRGALGERISQNVRKLVRREIALALSEREAAPGEQS